MILGLLVLASSALALSSLAALDRITIWRVIAIAIVTGRHAVYTPDNSSVPRLVGEGDRDAITLNSVQFNLARAVGLRSPACSTAPSARRLLRGERVGVLVLAVVSPAESPARPVISHPPLTHALRGINYVRRHARSVAMFLAMMSLFGSRTSS
jgi:hypothetical protein